MQTEYTWPEAPQNSKSYDMRQMVDAPAHMMKNPSSFGAGMMPGMGVMRNAPGMSDQSNLRMGNSASPPGPIAGLMGGRSGNLSATGGAGVMGGNPCADPSGIHGNLSNEGILGAVSPKGVLSSSSASSTSPRSGPGLLGEGPSTMLDGMPAQNPNPGPGPGMLPTPPHMQSASNPGMPGVPSFPPGQNPMMPMHQAYMNMMTSLATMPGFNIPGMPGVQKPLQPCVADETIQANQTLYINNIDDKVKTDQLKKDLNAMFSNFGKVLDIVAMKSFWRRGQAFVVYEEQESACKALKGLQGFVYHNKPLRINFAKSKSDVVSKNDGSYVERESGPRKPRGILQREEQLKHRYQQMLQMQKDQPNAMHKLDEMSQPVLTQDSVNSGGFNNQMRGGLPKGGVAMTDKQAMIAAATAQAEAAMADKKRQLEIGMAPQSGAGQFGIGAARSFYPAMSGGVGGMGSQANKVLYIDRLPEDCNEAELKFLFNQYPTLKEVRYVPAQRAAFVEYENENDAGAAMNSLQNFELKKGYTLKITYAK